MSIRPDLFARLLVAVLVTGFASGVSHAQDPFADVQIERIQISDGIWMLVGAGGNLAVTAGDDGVFLVDDQFAPLTEKILASIAEVTEHSVDFVLNTHWHADHTGGNENIGHQGALIVAHNNVRKRMSADHRNEIFGRTTPASPPAALPVVTFSEDVTFHLNGEEIHAIHVGPAHTDTDALVHFKNANVLHTGDLLFSEGFPFIDVTSGGDVNGVIEAMDFALTLVDDETKIIPGHGSLTDRGGLEKARNMIAAVRDNVQKLVDEGKSLEETQAAAPAEDYADEWGGAFVDADLFVKLVYMSLTE